MTGTVLVIGATGMTGRRLTPRLRARGVDVQAASRRPGVNQVPFDWDRPETHDGALAGTDAVYLITPALVEDPSPVVEPFLRRTAQAGVQRVVLLSSMGVDFPNEDGSSGRHQVERLVQSSGLDWTILRPGGFSQNFSESFLLPGILHADTVAAATGDGAVAFVDADDIAAVAATALLEPGHAGRTYVVTGPEALTFGDAADIIGRAAGRPTAYRPISSAAFSAMLHDAGMPPDYAAAIVRNQEAIREGWGGAVSPHVAEVTGREPTSFAAYAARAAGAWTR